MMGQLVLNLIPVVYCAYSGFMYPQNSCLNIFSVYIYKVNYNVSNLKSCILVLVRFLVDTEYTHLRHYIFH